jgi:hypothetical protein
VNSNSGPEQEIYDYDYEALEDIWLKSREAAEATEANQPHDANGIG